ncbi:MAG: nucleotidyl transferase AbiEii/AbiGii toxin family protein [Candidatus Diapherotrites archaeon]|nr:nucleotidyl transferase AbiEii/AbiGii toxin family protein [Candidatus Diapherotrites archaeon]
MIFEEREKLVFEMLERLKSADFVLIGGYAINAYTLPRFSVDCDLVVKNAGDAEKISSILKENGFLEKKESEKAYGGKFKSLGHSGEPKAAFDVLWGEVFDRKTGKPISAELLFKHSAVRTVFGRGSPIRIECRVADPEMLVAMKMLSCRKADIRDVFMLHSIKLDQNLVRELFKEIRIPKESIEEVRKTIQLKQFQDSLAGVYGKLQQKEFASTYQKTLKTVKALLNEPPVS